MTSYVQEKCNCCNGVKTRVIEEPQPEKPITFNVELPKKCRCK